MTSTPKRLKTPQRGPPASKSQGQKNAFEITDSESSSDIDFDLEMESIPVGKEKQSEFQNDDGEPPAESAAQLPELEDSDDDEQVRTSGNKLGPLYDFLLTQEQCIEPLDEWTYRSFIKEFATLEADQAGDEIDEEYKIADEEEDV